MREEGIQRAFSECEQYYRGLYGVCGEVLKASFRLDDGASQSESHHYTLDLEQWIAALSARPEARVFRGAQHEYHSALLALVLGQYRQAFMGLRLFLELALGGIYFSANELELRLWLRGRRDIGWERFVDPDRGVFSKCFVGAFYEALADEGPHYSAIAKQVYRECSEYVHGSARTHSTLPTAPEFAQHVFSDWHEKAKAARFVVSFALCSRYLKFLDEAALDALELIVTDELGHLTAIRVHFGGVGEVGS